MPVLVIAAAAILLPPIAFGSGLLIRPEILIVAAIVPWLAGKVKRDWLKDPFVWVWGGLLFSLTLSWVFAAWRLGVPMAARDITEYVRLGVYLLVYLAFRELGNPAQRSIQLAQLMAGAAVCLVLFGIAQWFDIFHVNSWLTPLYTDEEQMKGLSIKLIRRIVGTFGNPNNFGLYLALVLSGCLAWVTLGKLNNRQKVVVGLLGLLAVQNLLLTYSRTALAIVLLLVVYLLLAGGYSKRLKFGILGLLLVAIIAIAYFAPEDFTSRVRDGLNFTHATSYQGRLAYWEKAVEGIRTSPILGWGPAKTTMPTFTDNEYILTVRRYGFFGLGFYLAFYLVPLVTALKLARKSSSPAGQVFALTAQMLPIAYLLFNLTAGTFYNFQFMLPLLAYWGLSRGQLTKLG